MRFVSSFVFFFFVLLGVYHERCALVSPAAYPLIARVVRRNDDDDDDGDDEVVRGSGSRQQFFYCVFLDNDEKTNMLSRRGPQFYCIYVFFLFALFSFANRNARLPGEARSGKQARGPSSAPPSCRRRRRRRAVRVRACVSAPLLFGQVSIVSPSHNAIVTEEEEGTCF